MHGTSCEAVGDEMLVAQAAAGEVEAFDELYRRHHVLARRLAQRITGNDDDASDVAAEAFTRVFGVVSARGLRQHASFRSYLLTTVRHVGIDKVRQRRRVESTDQMGQFDGASPAQGPADATLRSEDRRLLIEAFRQLPERSRSVLWLVDVERVPTRVAAKALGLTPGNVAQIAVRARARLRHGYLRAHLAGTVAGECRFTVEHLGSFLDGDLCRTSVAKLDGHLEVCGSCRDRVEELRDLGVSTRRALVPALLIGRFRGAFPWARRSRAGHVVASADLAATIPAQTLPLGAQLAAVVSHPTAVDVLQSIGQSPVVQRLVATIAAGTMAVGASSMALKAAPAIPDAPAGVVVAAGPGFAGVGARPLDAARSGGAGSVGLSQVVPAAGGGGGGSGFAAASGGSVAAAATAPPTSVVPAPPAVITPATGAIAGVLPAPAIVSGATQALAATAGAVAVPPVALPPPESQVTALLPPAAQAIPSPTIPAVAVTVPLASGPPLTVPPLTGPLPLPTSGSPSTPLSVPPLTVPLAVPLSTPPLTVPSVPLAVPVSAPPLTVPSVPVVVSVPPAPVPVTVPPASVPVTVSDAVSTLPVSLPVAGPPLPIPPISAGPVSVPPIAAPPLAPLPLAVPLSTVTAGILR